MKTEKIYTQHEENKEWMSNLLFYSDEIVIMKNRLEEIAQKNTSKEIVVQVEHFQNQLILQKDYLDKIKHEIHVDNDFINNEINKNEIAVDHRSIEDHESIREDVNMFEKIFGTLKIEMNSFLSKRM